MAIKDLSVKRPAERGFRIKLSHGVENLSHSAFPGKNVGALPGVEHKKRQVCHGRRLEGALHFPLKKNRLILEVEQGCGDDAANPDGQ